MHTYGGSANGIPKKLVIESFEVPMTVASSRVTVGFVDAEMHAIETARDDQAILDGVRMVVGRGREGLGDRMARLYLNMPGPSSFL